MQTILSLSERLDMSAEEALDTLRKLRFEVGGVDEEINDDQCDLLMDVDEDPSTLEALLQEIQKKEAEKRKKAERLQKANEKRRLAAQKKAEAKAKAEAKKKAAKEKKEAEEAAKAKAETPAPEIVESETPPVEAVIVDEAPAETEPVSVAEVLSPETTPAEPEPAETSAEAPVSEPVQPEAAVAREAPVPASEGAPEASAEAAAPEEAEQAEAETGTAEARVFAEILPPVAESEEKGADEEADQHEGEGALAHAERMQEEKERKRNERPLPVPDPAVVAEVIRKAQERDQEKQERKRTSRQRQESPGEVPAKARGRQERPDHQAGPTPPLSPDDIQRSTARGKRGATGKTAKKRQRRAERARALEDTLRRDAAAAVRSYQFGGAAGGAPKKRRKKRREEGEHVEEQHGGVLEVDETMTVEQLADGMNADVNDIILALMEENVMANKNQTLEIDMIRTIAAQFDFEVRSVIPEEEELFAETPDDPESLQLRPPVVTIMGHVDHGKTSLLDVVRRANVAAGEAGGITQHIAAYDVELEQGRVVFLDTPGHEAFTQMRARGAGITDVVVLVVAADDGVKPQTIEAIAHARAAEVPIVVAVNKCDKPNAQPDRVRQELVQYELVDESWGGKTIIKNISCHTGEGIDDLMEMLVLESQMLELKANPDKHARGAIVESEISRGQGPTAWVMVQSGTLKVGDMFLAGQTYGRVRTMTNSRGRQVTEAGPSTPVFVTGFSEPATAGDQFVVSEDERTIRNVAEKRASVNRQKRGPAQKRMTLEDFHASMAGVEQKTLSIVLKADVQGSVDVLTSSLSKIGNDEVSVQVVHSGVGAVNESDIMLASASNAVVIGFHVTADARGQALAEQEGVDIRTYLVIYELLDEVKKAVEGLLTPDSKEVVLGHAEIRQVFRSSAIGNIAGCFQQDGETVRGGLARLVRDGKIVHTGRIGTLRREKDDVRTVSQGFECGMKLERFDDIQVGDIIESFKVEMVPKTLD